MFPTTTASITDVSSALAQSKVNQNVSTGAKAFIRFDFKTGEFSFGRDNEDITESEIVVNTTSFCHGWVLWVNGTPSKVMRSFVENLPDPMPNSPTGDSPSEARGFEARFADDPETVLMFETSSYGGRKGCDTLLNQIRARSAGGETEYLFPVVKLESESYRSKQGSKIHNPLFTVVGWVNQAGDRQNVAKQIEEQVEEPVVRRRRNAQ